MQHLKEPTRRWTVFNCSYTDVIETHKLVKHPKNPNTHSEKQIERLAKIIDYQGQRSPIIISKRSGFVVAGHGRLMAMEKLGWDKVAVDYQDFADDAQEYAHMTADNAIAEWSDLDLSQVNQDFLDFGPEFDIELLGLKDFVVDLSDTFDVDEKAPEDKSSKYLLEVEFPNEMEMRDIFDDLCARGYLAKIK